MYEPTPATTPSRHSERAVHDREMIHSILDEALIGHLAFVIDGAPHVLPLLFVRVEDSVFLHGSTGAHFARVAGKGGGLQVCFEATLVDGLVLARSAFSHSANYRSVVAHGEASLVRDEDQKELVLLALMDKLVPGRKADARAPELLELRKTSVLELPLTSVGAKVRTGGPLDGEPDLDLDVWAGVRPIVVGWGAPEPSADLKAGVPVPAYLQDAASFGAAAGAALTV